jgi:hypothetical protein
MRGIFLGMLMGLATVCGEEVERPLLYPFEVTLGGQKAEIGEWGDLFAVVKVPVKADAVLSLEKEAPMLIVNAFPCKEDGTILMDGAPAAVIFANQTKEVKLDATMDKKKLAPGTYLMNVVANGKTSRVVFTVTDGGKVKLPDFGKLMNFLKGKG